MRSVNLASEPRKIHVSLYGYGMFDNDDMIKVVKCDLTREDASCSSKTASGPLSVCNQLRH